VTASFYKDVRQTLRSLCPQACSTGGKARFYGPLRRVELHLLKSCVNAIATPSDVGAQ